MTPHGFRGFQKVENLDFRRLEIWLSLDFRKLACLPLAADAGAVQALTRADFDERVGAAGEAPWLVKFYAPRCGHCKVRHRVLGTRTGLGAGIVRGNHLSNTTCLTHVFFKRDCSKS